MAGIWPSMAWQEILNLSFHLFYLLATFEELGRG